MKVKSIFVNLPTKDLNKTREFWTSLGFSFNEQFSNDKALCLALHEGLVCAMLIDHDMFSTFYQQTDCRWHNYTGINCIGSGKQGTG